MTASRESSHFGVYQTSAMFSVGVALSGFLYRPISTKSWLQVHILGHCEPPYKATHKITSMVKLKAITGVYLSAKNPMTSPPTVPAMVDNEPIHATLLKKSSTEWTITKSLNPELGFSTIPITPPKALHLNND